MKICFPLVNEPPLAGSSTCPAIDDARLAHPGSARARAVGKTAEVANAATAPRRNIWREIMGRIVKRGVPSAAGYEPRQNANLNVNVPQM
ncbi:hypothetical protein LRC484719_38760 [Mycobacterium riyadhense]